MDSCNRSLSPRAIHLSLSTISVQKEQEILWFVFCVWKLKFLRYLISFSHHQLYVLLRGKAIYLMDENRADLSLPGLSHKNHSILILLKRT